MATGGLSIQRPEFPKGLKAGDFIQLNSHFGDIYFEVASVMDPGLTDGYWMIDYYTYDKYGGKPRKKWTNSGSSGVRRVIAAEMAVPTIMFKRARFHASVGQFDPCFGFAPAGVALRRREEVAAA